MNLFGLLSEVLSVWEDSDPYWRIENADGKVWLMPRRRLRTAMNLYQPSGRNGKLLKTLLPAVQWLPLPWRRLHIEQTRCSLVDDLYRRLCELFGVERLEFAIFCGTPCVHQKLTLQLSTGSRILGYCKVSDNPEIAALFAHEAAMLDRLHGLGIADVPRALFAGEWRGGIHLFVQTTCKTSRSRIPHQWGPLQEEFLDRLCEQTRQRLPFEQTDYRQTLLQLQQHLDYLPTDEARSLVAAAIEAVVSEYSGKEVECSAYHADFTPWNMLVESGRLFVFDWEYVRASYPPRLDRYHHFTQTAIFERRWGAAEIIRWIEAGREPWLDRAAYRLYLLDIISRFAMRERGQFAGDVARSLSIWLQLLEYTVR